MAADIASAGAGSTQARGPDSGPRSLTAVLAVAVVVRIAVGLVRGPELLYEGNGLYYMHHLAVAVADGRGYVCAHGVTNVFQQPGYPFALAVAYRLFGAGWPAALVVGTLIGVVTTWAVFRLAEWAVGRRPAVAAAAIVAVHPVLVWHGLGVADTGLFSACLVASLACLVRAFDAVPRRLAFSVAGGLWLGLGMLTRPSMLPILPVAGLALAWGRRAEWRRWLPRVTVMLAVGIGVTLPWAARNAQLTGVFPMLGTHGPESVWAANNRFAREATDQDSSYDAVSRRAEFRGNDLDVWYLQCMAEPTEAVRRERVFSAAFREWVRENPGEFVTLTTRRLLRMWGPTYSPQTWNGADRARTPARVWMHVLTHIPLCLLAIAGTVMALRDPTRRRGVVVLLCVIAAYSVSHAVGAGYSRVRYVVDPLVAILAAVPLAAAWDAWRTRRATPGGSDPGRD